MELQVIVVKFSFYVNQRQGQMAAARLTFKTVLFPHCGRNSVALAHFLNQIYAAKM
jgi:hypothetical protein